MNAKAIRRYRLIKMHTQRNRLRQLHKRLHKQAFATKRSPVIAAVIFAYV